MDFLDDLIVGIARRTLGGVMTIARVFVYIQLLTVLALVATIFLTLIYVAIRIAF